MSCLVVALHFGKDEHIFFGTMAIDQLPLKKTIPVFLTLSTPNLCLDRRAVAKFGPDGVVAGTGASACWICPLLLLDNSTTGLTETTFTK